MPNTRHVTLAEVLGACAIAENVKADGLAVGAANAHAHARAFHDIVRPNVGTDLAAKRSHALKLTHAAIHAIHLVSEVRRCGDVAFTRFARGEVTADVVLLINNRERCWADHAQRCMGEARAAWVRVRAL